MYYELYIDMFFGINMVMDYILLRLVDKILKCSTTHLRSLFGSLIGATGICIVAVLPIHNILLNTILVHVVINTMMVRFGCKIKGLKSVLKGVLILYTVTLLCGGVFSTLLRYTKYTFLLLSAMSYLLIQAGIKLYEVLKHKEAHFYDVTISLGGTYRQLKGLYDTGNQLKDPWSAKPVCVIADGVLDEFYDFDPFEKIEIYKPHYIPFHSIGKTQGAILAVTIESLTIHMGKEERTYKSPVIAIAKEKISSDDSYQLILNANLIDK